MTESWNPDNVNSTNCKSFFPFMDYSPLEMNGKTLHFYETIKVRNLLNKYERAKGYPTNFNHYVGYYSGMGFWVPNGWIVMNKITTDWWKKLTKDWWRNVRIGFVGEQFDPSSLLNFGLYGFSIGTIVTPNTEVQWPIFKNLAFRATINDKVILANWSEVKSFIYDNNLLN